MKLIKLLWLVPFFGMAPCFAGTISYLVSVNTTSLAPGTAGIIDLTFNGGFPDGQASISSFLNVGGTLDGSSITKQGTIFGMLPGTLTENDNNADYDENLTFGSSLSFVLTLSGTPVGAQGDTFGLSFFTPAFGATLLTSQVNTGLLATVSTSAAGSTTTTAFRSPSGAQSFATITPIPEPAAGVLVVVGLLGAWAFCRFRSWKVAAVSFTPCRGHS